MVKRTDCLWARRLLIALRALRPVRLVNKLDGLRRIYASLSMALKDVGAMVSNTVKAAALLDSEIRAHLTPLQLRQAAARRSQ